MGSRWRRRTKTLAVAAGIVALITGFVLFPGHVHELTGTSRAGPDPAAGLGGRDPEAGAPAHRGAAPVERSPTTDPGDPPPGDGEPSPCGPFPRFPDETCTGWRHTGVTLRDCPTTITEPGATLDGCRFTGGLEIEAADVTITRSRIEGLVRPRADLQNLRLVDVEIDGTGRIDPSNPDSQLAIGNNNYTCIRCHIHATGRGANLGSNVHIEDSYLHDFPYMNGKHMTAIGSNGGSHFTILHNNLECSVTGCSAALSFYGDFAPISDVLVQHNLLNTTGSYCTYAGSVSSKEYPVGTDIRYLDNRFGKKFRDKCGQYGPVTSWRDGGGNEWRGNAWLDGSGPVEP